MSKPIQTVEELDAVLHWRGKHAQAIRERDALQLDLNQRDEQIATLDLQREAHLRNSQVAERRVGVLEQEVERLGRVTMTTNQTIDGVPREQMACMPVERCYDVRAKMIIAFNHARQNGGDLDDALDAAYKSALRFSPHPA